MVSRIFEFALRQRVFVLFATFALIAAGLWSASRLKLDAVPDITNVQVQVNTAVNAYAAEEIEKLITFPIETEMSGLPGLEEMRSISRFGLSQVTLVFADGATFTACGSSSRSGCRTPSLSWPRAQRQSSNPSRQE